MAIFLIRDSDRLHADPVKDARGCHKRGDIVAVFDDTETVVDRPAPPFLVVQVTGVTKAQAEKYLDPEMDPVDPTVTIRRRKYGLALDALPPAILTTLTTNRKITVTAAQVRDYLRNKTTGQAE